MKWQKLSSQFKEGIEMRELEKKVYFKFQALGMSEKPMHFMFFASGKTINTADVKKS